MSCKYESRHPNRERIFRKTLGTQFSTIDSSSSSPTRMVVLRVISNSSITTCDQRQTSVVSKSGGGPLGPLCSPSANKLLPMFATDCRVFFRLFRTCCSWARRARSRSTVTPRTLSQAAQFFVSWKSCGMVPSLPLMRPCEEDEEETAGPASEAPTSMSLNRTVAIMYTIYGVNLVQRRQAYTSDRGKFLGIDLSDAKHM
mmetsp:Transcript_1529/g.3231  ORF Transcript_1529/g.3231 Transcript_1529/m.3231 type:complete len:200 (-) Transcript_1529:8-607(-)